LLLLRCCLRLLRCRRSPSLPFLLLLDSDPYDSYLLGSFSSDPLRLTRSEEAVNPAPSGSGTTWTSWAKTLSRSSLDLETGSESGCGSHGRRRRRRCRSNVCCCCEACDDQLPNGLALQLQLRTSKPPPTPPASGPWFGGVGCCPGRCIAKFQIPNPEARTP
jgi:hypothetical protein